MCNSVTVKATEGGWQVWAGGQSTPHLQTGRRTPADWAKVECHVRALLGQPTPVEQAAATLNTVLEQLGVEHPLGAECQAMLIQLGLD